PALRAGFPSVQRVWISDDHVATFEHAVVDGHHGLPVGAALGAHVDNPPPRIPPALTHRASPSPAPTQANSGVASWFRSSDGIGQHAEKIVLFQLPIHQR